MPNKLIKREIFFRILMCSFSLVKGSQLNFETLRIELFAMRFGIIGAGPAGLCAIKRCLESDCDVIAFEQSNNIGGTWNYTEEVDKDKYGLEIHSSMYRGLISNTPKEIMAYPDFPMATIGNSFVNALAILKYFDSYASTFDLLRYIKFEHQVLRIRPLNDDTWEVVTINLPDNSPETFIFDAVLVCSGLSDPCIPTIPGQEIFNGQQFHSHSYRTSEKYENENVLIVGCGPSGIDLTVEIGKVAKRVFWSNHLNAATKFSITLPKVVSEKPDVLRLTETGAEFADGSFEEFSVIFYSTGFDFKLPFLSIECGLSSHDKYIQPLYKHCININKPTLGLIGIPGFSLAMPMFDLQVRFCLKFMMKEKKLPSQDEMIIDTQDEMNERFKLMKRDKAHFMGVERHAKYYEDLAVTANIEPLKSFIANIFTTNFSNFFECFDTFRDFHYKVLDDENFSVTRCKK